MTLLVDAISFPNEIVGSPEIICDKSEITLKVQTKLDPPSHIFVTNHYDLSNCTVMNTNQIVFQLGTCGMTRKRLVKY